MTLDDDVLTELHLTQQLGQPRLGSLGHRDDMRVEAQNRHVGTLYRFLCRMQGGRAPGGRLPGAVPDKGSAIAPGVSPARGGGCVVGLARVGLMALFIVMAANLRLGL